MKLILFVEDDAILARVYRKTLEAAGFEVRHAPDGEAGMAALQALRPDLILLDLMLPRVSGVELLRFIRSSRETKDTPVVVFTSAYRESVRAEVEALGATRVLSKAEFVPREVIAVIQELLPEQEGSPLPEDADPNALAGLAEAVTTLLARCGQIMAGLNRAAPLDLQGERFRPLRDGVKELADVALVMEYGPQAYFCEALLALLYEAMERPRQLGVSGLRTVTQAVDFLNEAFDRNRRLELEACPLFDILAVDDDAISRRGIQLALGRIKQKALECAEAGEALTLCAGRKFDLIFLDVGLPDSSGYEICSQLRHGGANQTTPVIFVTLHSDLQSRAQATLSGATDIIGKPFNFMELAVKALVHLLRSKLTRGSPAAPE
jgi:DNA-binding response OmpR family regulator